MSIDISDNLDDNILHKKALYFYEHINEEILNKLDSFNQMLFENLTNIKNNKDNTLTRLLKLNSTSYNNLTIHQNQLSIMKQGIKMPSGTASLFYYLENYKIENFKTLYEDITDDNKGEFMAILGSLTHLFYLLNNYLIFYNDDERIKIYDGLYKKIDDCLYTVIDQKAVNDEIGLLEIGIILGTFVGLPKSTAKSKGFKDTIKYIFAKFTPGSKMKPKKDQIILRDVLDESRRLALLTPIQKSMIINKKTIKAHNLMGRKLLTIEAIDNLNKKLVINDIEKRSDIIYMEDLARDTSVVTDPPIEKYNDLESINYSKLQLDIELLYLNTGTSKGTKVEEMEYSGTDLVVKYNVTDYEYDMARKASNLVFPEYFHNVAISKVFASKRGHPKHGNTLVFVTARGRPLPMMPNIITIDWIDWFRFKDAIKWTNSQGVFHFDYKNFKNVYFTQTGGYRDIETGKMVGQRTHFEIIDWDGGKKDGNIPKIRGDPATDDASVEYLEEYLIYQGILDKKKKATKWQLYQNEVNDRNLTSSDSLDEALVKESDVYYEERKRFMGDETDITVTIDEDNIVKIRSSKEANEILKKIYSEKLLESKIVRFIELKKDSGEYGIEIVDLPFNTYVNFDKGNYPLLNPVVEPITQNHRDLIMTTEVTTEKALLAF